MARTPPGVSRVADTPGSAIGRLNVLKIGDQTVSRPNHPCLPHSRKWNRSFVTRLCLGNKPPWKLKHFFHWQRHNSVLYHLKIQLEGN